MKLTDYCILFGMLLVGLFVYDDLKLRAINEMQISKMLLNKNMDEIVVDGLYAGFVGVDEGDNVKVNLDVASNHIFEEMSMLFYGKGDMRSMVERYVKALIYVVEDGYFVYDGEMWSEEILFPDEATHSEKVDIVAKVIEEKTGELPLLSYNDGESHKNTIDDNTLIIAYCGYNFITSEFVYKDSYLSAACIKERK